MTTLFQCALLAIVTVELAIQLPLRRGIVAIRNAGERSVRVIQSPFISDHWKEKVLVAYAARIAKASLGVAAISLLLGLAAIVLVLTLRYLGLSSRGLEILVSPRDLALMVLLAILYAALRAKLG